MSSFCGDQVGKFVGSNTNHTTHHATSLPGALKSRESLDGNIIILLVPFYFLAKGNETTLHIDCLIEDFSKLTEETEGQGGCCKTGRSVDLVDVDQDCYNQQISVFLITIIVWKETMSPRMANGASA